MLNRHVRGLLFLLPVLLTSTAPAQAQTTAPGTAYHGPKVYGDDLRDGVGRWMKAQAVYWRRVQFADIAHLAGTKAWYQQAYVIDAQLYVQDAKVALLIDDNVKQARQALDRAKGLLKQGEKGAGKAQASKIKQAAGTISGIEGDMPHSPAASPKQTRKSAQAMADVFRTLREIVEKG